MRSFTDDARTLLITAAEVARFRGAQECDATDVKVAGLLLSLHPGASVYADAENSSSPLQMPLAEGLQSIVTSSSEELGVEELLRCGGNS